jgi:hypothetical protein
MTVIQKVEKSELLKVEKLGKRMGTSKAALKDIQ